MTSKHQVIFADCSNMWEIQDGSVHLVVTSPPYYNAPFDYAGRFENYDAFLTFMEGVAKELYRVVADGRIACIIVDDTIVDGEKYPVVFDVASAMRLAGFRYRDKIMWVKPKGYVRISRRSGVVLQHPYPMYFYPDNIQESILIFQKGRFDYGYVRSLSKDDRERSRIDTKAFNRDGWHLTVWHITNVLPGKGRLERGVAAFPEELPRRLITLYSFVGETVLDPFLGSGTTSLVAARLQRSSVGYENDLRLKPIITKKLESVDGVRFIERFSRNGAPAFTRA